MAVTSVHSAHTAPNFRTGRPTHNHPDKADYVSMCCDTILSPPASHRLQGILIDAACVSQVGLWARTYAFSPGTAILPPSKGMEWRNARDLRRGISVNPFHVLDSSFACDFADQSGHRGIPGRPNSADSTLPGRHTSRSDKIGMPTQRQIC